MAKERVKKSLICVVCKKQFWAVRKDAEHCGATCRSEANRERQKLAASAVAQPQKVTGPPASPQADAAAERALHRAARLTAARSAGLSPRPRVPLEDQVLSQASAKAFFYQILLGLDAQGQPIYAPPQGSFSLYPFSLPDDLRLEEGKTYRIIYRDDHGFPLPPSDIEAAPILHFFLGPPDSPISLEALQTRYSMNLRRISERAELMNQNLRSQHARELQIVTQMKEEQQRELDKFKKEDRERKRRKKEARRKKKEERELEELFPKKAIEAAKEGRSLLTLAAAVLGGILGTLLLQSKRSKPLRTLFQEFYYRIFGHSDSGKSVGEMLNSIGTKVRRSLLILADSLSAYANTPQSKDPASGNPKPGHTTPPEQPKPAVSAAAPAAPPQPPQSEGGAGAAQPEITTTTRAVPEPATALLNAQPMPQQPTFAKANQALAKKLRRPKKIYQPAMEPGQAARLLAELCEVPPQESSDPQSRGGHEAPEPLADILMRSLELSPVGENPSAPSVPLFLNAAQALAGLAALGLKIKEAADTQASFKGHAVTPLALTLIQQILRQQERLTAFLTEYYKSQKPRRDTLESLGQNLAELKKWLLQEIDGPETPLEQVLYEGLRNIRRILRSDSTSAAYALDTAEAQNAAPTPEGTTLAA